MKSQKGITLLSLTIYLIAMTIIVAILGIITNFFFSNKEYLEDTSRYIAEYNKFNMYFIDDVKNNKSAVVTEDTITFENGIIYKYMR